MSSKAALSILSVAVASSSNLPIVFHMDSMYTCNLNEFPVLVFGITDAQQKFHMLSVSMISHHTKATYTDLLMSFKRLLSHALPSYICSRVWNDRL